MTPEKIVENHKKYVLQSWSNQGNLNPIPVAKADGIYFYDFDGNRYVITACKPQSRLRK